MAAKSQSLVSLYLALALVVLKSKPASTTVEDYMVALRSSVIYSKFDNRGLITVHSSAFWKRLFDWTRQENLHLRAEVASRRAGEQFHEQSASNADRFGVGKRRLCSSPNIECDMPFKRIKTLQWEKTQLHVDPPSPPLEQHQDRSTALRVIFSLAHDKQFDSATDDGCAPICPLACDTIIELFRNADASSIELRAQNSRPLTLHEASLASKKIWSLLMTKLTDTPTIDTNPKYIPVSGPLSEVIRTLLNALHECASQGASQWSRENMKTSKAKNCKVNSADTDEMMSELFGTICGQHPETYNCVAATFLQSLGFVMSILLFCDDECEDAGPGLLPPLGLENLHYDSGRDIALAARIEAPHLVTVLKSFMNSVLTAKAKTGATSTAIESMQRRLVDSIFHEQITMVKTSWSSDNSIKASSRECKAIRISRVGMHPDTTVFFSQIWDLLGWDVLMVDADLGQTPRKT